MDAKQFLKEKGISNNDFMDCGVADLIETLLTEYQALKLQQTGVIVQSEQLKTCEHNFTDIYDNTGTQIVGKKCLNGCGF